MSELKLKSIKDLSSEIDKFLSAKTFKNEVFLSLINEYQNIAEDLITDKKTPETVLKYLSDNKTKITDKKYKALNKISDLNLKCFNFYEQKIKTLIKDGKYKNITPILIEAITLSSDNLKLITLTEKYFMKEKFDLELIDIYKTLFLHSSNPDYFMKIGDIYYKNKNYQEALNHYLNYAESGEQTVEIFTKLAKVFEKINDNESRLACLEEIKRIQSDEL